MSFICEYCINKRTEQNKSFSSRYLLNAHTRGSIHKALTEDGKLKCKALELAPRQLKSKEALRENSIKCCKEWYKRNKQTHLEKVTAKVLCECGTMSDYSHLKNHQRSNKHKKLMSLKQEKINIKLL